MILNTIEAGSGPPIALLHGLFGRAQNLASIARALSATNRVLSLDIRNHGASRHEPAMDYPTLAADVLETLAAHNALPITLLGHSMGGKTAMAAALAAPSAITRLIVADIAPVPYTHTNRDIAVALLSVPLNPTLTRATADAMLARSIHDPAVRAFLLQNLILSPTPTWRIALPEIAAAMPLLEGWPNFTTTYPGPTFFIRGEHSDYVLPEHTPFIKSLFPTAEITTLPNAGHWLHADQPLAFNKMIAQIIREAV
jgi:esterase